MSRLRIIAHNLTHSHRRADKDGVGTFIICTLAMPGGRSSIAFRPDLAGAGWHPVPRAYGEDGRLLFSRMLGASSAEEAMALLREPS